MPRNIWSRRVIWAAILVPLGFMAFPAPARADPTLPPRKPGFWQTTMAMKMIVNGQPVNMPMGGPGGMIIGMCIDPTTDMKMMEHIGGDGRVHCSKAAFTDTGGGVYNISNSCKTDDGNTIMMNGTITYLGDTELHVAVAMKSAQMNSTMQQISKWTGACPAGVTPGDFGMMTGGNFQKMSNINDVSH